MARRDSYKVAPMFGKKAVSEKANKKLFPINFNTMGRGILDIDTARQLFWAEENKADLVKDDGFALDDFAQRKSHFLISMSELGNVKVLQAHWKQNPDSPEKRAMLTLVKS